MEIVMGTKGSSSSGYVHSVPLTDEEKEQIRRAFSKQGQQHSQHSIEDQIILRDIIDGYGEKPAK